MNKYSLDFDKKASKDLLSLDKSVRNFILDELEIFIKFFDVYNCVYGKRPKIFL